MKRTESLLWLLSRLNHPYVRALFLLAALTAFVLGAGAPEGFGGP